MTKYESGDFSQGNHVVRHTSIKIDTINIEITNIYNFFFYSSWPLEWFICKYCNIAFLIFKSQIFGIHIILPFPYFKQNFKLISSVKIQLDRRFILIHSLLCLQSFTSLHLSYLPSVCNTISSPLPFILTLLFFPSSFLAESCSLGSHTSVPPPFDITHCCCCCPPNLCWQTTDGAKEADRKK